MYVYVSVYIYMCVYICNPLWQIKMKNIYMFIDNYQAGRPYWMSIIYIFLDILFSVSFFYFFKSTFILLKYSWLSMFQVHSVAIQFIICVLNISFLILFYFI